MNGDKWILVFTEVVALSLISIWWFIASSLLSAGFTLKLIVTTSMIVFATIYNVLLYKWCKE